MLRRSATPAPPDPIESYVAFLGEGAGQGLPVEVEHYDPIQDAVSLRSEVQDFEQLQRDKFDHYLQSVYAGSLPPGVSRRVRPTSEWLAYDATDEQITDFLARHRPILQEQRQDPGIGERFDLYKDEYVRRLYDGITEGWVSPHAENKIHRIEKATLEIGDIRHTSLQWKTAQYIGPYNKIIIAQGTGLDRAGRAREVVGNIRDSLPHEASHVFGRWLPHWASEGFAEQMNLVVRNGEPFVFNPTARTHDQSIYYAAERALLHGMFYLSPAGFAAGEEVAARFMRGATSRSPDSAEWRHFESELDRVWGSKDTFRHVTARIDTEEAQIRLENPNWNDWQVEREAAIRVKNDLDVAPQKIFGENYKKPQPHVGAAALSGAVR